MYEAADPHITTLCAIKKIKVHPKMNYSIIFHFNFTKNLKEYEYINFSKISWDNSNNQPFLNGKYSREHIWELDNGNKINASSSPHIVPIPLSNPEFIDPEEAFICSISSCHMLFFLFIAAKKKIEVLKYIETPIGRLSKNDSNKVTISEIILQPKVTFQQEISNESLEKIHHLAHQNCFIANSINSDIQIKPLNL